MEGPADTGAGGGPVANIPEAGDSLVGGTADAGDRLVEGTADAGDWLVEGPMANIPEAGDALVGGTADAGDGLVGGTADAGDWLVEVFRVSFIEITSRPSGNISRMWKAPEGCLVSPVAHGVLHLTMAGHCSSPAQLHESNLY